MRSVSAIWLLLVFGYISVAQENTSSLLTQAEDAVYSDPQEAIRIANYISEKSDQPVQLQKAAYLLTLAFYIEGKYNEALKTGLKSSEVDLESDTKTQLELNILLSKILKELELNSLASKYSSKAANLLKEGTDSNTRNWVEGKIMQYALNKDQEDGSNETFDQVYNAKSKFKKITSDGYPFQIGNINLELATMHLREFQLDSAQYYLSTAFLESKKIKTDNYLEMKSLIKYGDYLFQKKAYSEAIDTLNSAMRIAQKFTNIPAQIAISQEISKDYLALNDFKEFNNYTQEIEELSSKQDDTENEVINTAYNFYNSNEIQKFKELQATSQWSLFVLGSIFLLLLLFWGVTKIRYHAKIKQYRKLIDFLEKRKESLDVSPSTKLDTPKQLNIPKEAEGYLLAKLNTFENSLDFINREISLSRLALQFETNTKYLSEIINSHKQKNFNGYINELRINYIIDKLKNDPKYLHYKISYLAEDSGFSSHSVFTAVFKSVAGISPTSFITILRNKQESTIITA